MEPHPSIARERHICLRNDMNSTRKASKNSRETAPFHVKHSIKLPASLPAPRHDRRHAPPGTQENGTGSGATTLDAHHGTIRNAQRTPISTAGTPDMHRKILRRREGSQQERHRRCPKCDDGTPTEGENGSETTRLAARKADRWASRGEIEHGTAAESMGTGGNRGAGGEGNGLGRGDYRVKTGDSREGGERRCRFER